MNGAREGNKRERTQQSVLSSLKGLLTQERTENVARKKKKISEGIKNNNR